MKELYKGKWIHAEEDDFFHAMPERDILPHSTQTNGKKRDIANLQCPCKPKIAMGDSDYIYEKPCIIHNSFQDKEYLDSIGL